MIQITRNLIRQLRPVFKRLAPKRRDNALVHFQAGRDGLTIRLKSYETAVEYRLAGEFADEIHAVPLSLLVSLEGKNGDLVKFSHGQNGDTLVEWADGRIPRRETVTSNEQDRLTDFPPEPSEFAANPPELLKALADATRCADKEAIRYALNHLQLRGRQGQVIATDGHHLLSQSGFTFPWQNDALIPASSLLRSAELQGDSVNIGVMDKWACIEIGPWRLYLLLDKDSRYPRIDDVIPKPERFITRLHLSDDDAQFLAETLPKLPDDDMSSDHPITLDLTGELVIRANCFVRPQPTELVLTSSRLEGEPVCTCINRHFLARALQMGFRSVALISADAILCCEDGQRKYLIMPVAKESQVKTSADALRIESGKVEQIASNEPSTISIRSTTTVAASTQIRPAAQQEQTSSPATDNKVKSSIEQALALRDSLRAAAGQANGLVKSLKRHRRESQLVKQTLASLEQLQKAA